MNLVFIDSLDKIGLLLNALEKVDVIGLDVETTSLDPYSAKLLLVQLAVNGDIFVLDARKLGSKNITYVVQIVKDSNKLCIGHNIKFDLKILYHNTSEMIENVFDTMLAETLIYNGLGDGFYKSYDYLVYKYFGIELDKTTRESFIDFDGELNNNQINYSALDVKYLMALMDIQVKQLLEQGQENVMNLEMSLVPVFTAIEYYGYFRKNCRIGRFF